MRKAFEQTFEVVVAGGGIAGVAAAIQAARRGKKTVLVEKTVQPGGLATTGLVNVYLPLCDGNGHQVTFGLCEELIRRSLQYGPGDLPVQWGGEAAGGESERFLCRFSPAAYVLALEEMLLENGVELWYDTLICDTVVADGKVVAVEVENKSGRGVLHAGCVVDATGDCEVARRAGVPCLDDDNFLSIWALEYDRDAQGEWLLVPGVSMHVDGVPWSVEKAPPGTVFRGVSGRLVTDFMVRSREMLRAHYRRAEQEGRARKDQFVLTLPGMPQFRKVYCLDAAYVLDSGENGRRFEDSVGLAGDWRQAGPVWEIPYRSLYPRTPLNGLLAAGRCTGARGDAWEITRVIPVAAMTGQVAGLAAALALENGVEVRSLDVKLLQRELVQCGFRLHLPDVGLAYAGV